MDLRTAKMLVEDYILDERINFRDYYCAVLKNSHMYSYWDVQ